MTTDVDLSSVLSENDFNTSRDTEEQERRPTRRPCPAQPEPDEQMLPTPEASVSVPVTTAAESHSTIDQETQPLPLPYPSIHDCVTLPLDDITQSIDDLLTGSVENPLPLIHELCTQPIIQVNVVLVSNRFQVALDETPLKMRQFSFLYFILAHLLIN